MEDLFKLHGKLSSFLNEFDPALYRLYFYMYFDECKDSESNLDFELQIFILLNLMRGMVKDSQDNIFLEGVDKRFDLFLEVLEKVSALDDDFFLLQYSMAQRVLVGLMVESADLGYDIAQLDWAPNVLDSMDIFEEKHGLALDGRELLWNALSRHFEDPISSS